DVRPALTALQTRDLVTLLRNYPLKLRHSTEQLDHQCLQIGIRKRLNVRRRHGRNESDTRLVVNPPSSFRVNLTRHAATTFAPLTECGMWNVRWPAQRGIAPGSHRETVFGRKAKNRP